MISIVKFAIVLRFPSEFMVNRLHGLKLVLKLNITKAFMKLLCVDEVLRIIMQRVHASTRYRFNFN